MKCFTLQHSQYYNMPQHMNKVDWIDMQESVLGDY
jgi:hypothetical protein